jgi:hypothetical protein
MLILLHQVQENHFFIACYGETLEVYYQIDEVYVNGTKVGNLNSGNDLWSREENEFSFDVGLLNFPTYEGGAASNSIQIKIDVKNSELPPNNCVQYATEIDFLTIQYEVIDPFVLIPGLGGSPSSFAASGYVENLKNTYGIPSKILSYDSPLITPLNQGCAAFPSSYNQTTIPIKDKIVQAANEWGTDAINIIAHSKGGLEGVNLINSLLFNETMVDAGVFNDAIIESRLKVNTLSTHGSPFEGTRLADKLIQPIAKVSYQFTLTQDLLIGLCDLTVKGQLISQIIWI